MNHHNRQNPFYEHFDELLEICREHDVTCLSVMVFGLGVWLMLQMTRSLRNSQFWASWLQDAVMPECRLWLKVPGIFR
jgi:hypothetical protein